MSCQTKVVADSIGPHGHRLTTMICTFPRFILAEVNTHRMLSRNSASSRAIPPEIMIERVKTDPFVPEVFRRRIKGMGQGDEILGDDAIKSREAWLWAAEQAIVAAQALIDADVSKAHVNRILEPFLWHTALITATEWDNFFALRQPMNDDPVPQNDHGAQPEFQIIARMMRDAMRASEPDHLDYGDWHLPFVDADERATCFNEEVVEYEHDYWPLVSAGRCFVVSYDKLATITDEHHGKSFARAEGGRAVGHWSPLEHPAVCVNPALSPHDDYGNFVGWRQLRKHYPNEDDFSKVLA